MPSFDVVSEVDLQEVDNAVNQAKKEIGGRYDFRGSKARIDWDKVEIQVFAEDDYKLGAMKEILLKKLHHRGIDIKAIKFDDPEPVGGMLFKQKVSLVQGIDKEMGKKINQDIKEAKLKVQSQIQDEKLRVTSKSIDELQSCMALLKKGDYKIPLQFTNLRA